MLRSLTSACSWCRGEIQVLLVITFHNQSVLLVATAQILGFYIPTLIMEFPPPPLGGELSFGKWFLFQNLCTPLFGERLSLWDVICKFPSCSSPLQGYPLFSCGQKRYPPLCGVPLPLTCTFWISDRSPLTRSETLLCGWFQNSICVSPPCGLKSSL